MWKIFNQLNPWWGKQPIDTKIIRQKYLAIFQKNLDNKEILLLLGSRRVGKTTIMKQWINYLIKEQGVPKEKILYILLDHPELMNKSLLQIVEEFYREQKINNQDKVFIFFDEIQYRKNWDQEVKALYETNNIKFILSGSAISLISRQRNYLTGRFLKYIVQPLNYEEFKIFTSKNTLLDYLKNGGYPEYVINSDPQYLLDLIDSIVYKDIVEVYQIRQPQIIKDLLLILARAVGYKISLNKIAKTLKISIETVKDYLHFLAEVYLVYEVPKFSNSLNEQIYNEKKYYFYDTGLAKVLSNKDNLGSLAENAVANYLKNKNLNISYFYEDKKECDFIIKKLDQAGNFVYQPIEVKFDIQTKDFDLQHKGLAGFYLAAKLTSSETSIVITQQTDKISEDFQLISLEKFLKS